MVCTDDSASPAGELNWFSGRAVHPPTAHTRTSPLESPGRGQIACAIYAELTCDSLTHRPASDRFMGEAGDLGLVERSWSTLVSCIGFMYQPCSASPAGHGRAGMSAVIVVFGDIEKFRERSK